MIDFLISFSMGVVLGAVATPIRERLSAMARRVGPGHGLRVSIDRNPDSPAAYGYYIDEIPSVGWPPPADHLRWADWAYSIGGHDIRLTELRVTVQATADTTVVLGFPQLVRRREWAAPGYALWGLGRGGGEIVPLILRINLDEPDIPSLGYEVGQGMARQRHSIKMQKGDVNEIWITASADDDAVYYWWLNLPIIIDGVSKTVRIDDSGLPFVTRGFDTEVASITLEDGQWVVPPRPQLG